MRINFVCWQATIRFKLLVQLPLFYFIYVVSSYELQTDGLTVITENDWKCFCEEWGGIEGKGISAWIELSSAAGSNLDSSCEEMPKGEEDQGHLDEVNDENETRIPLMKTSPEVF